MASKLTARIYIRRLRRAAANLTFRSRRWHATHDRAAFEQVGAARENSWLTPLLINMIEGRSGTTVLMRLLDHDQVVFDRTYPYERRYLTYLLHLLTPSGEPFEETSIWNGSLMLEGDPLRFGPLPFEPRSLNIRDLRIRLVRHSWAALSEAFTTFARHDVRYYAEKTWGNNLSLLAEAGISAAVINLVRDPRDVVASIRAMDAKRGYFGFGRTPDMTGEEYLLFLLRSMATNLASMSSLNPLHNSFLVRYEDLVTNPDAIATRLGAFLKLDLTASSTLVAERMFKRHATSSDALSSIGRWRRDLGSAEVATIERQLGVEMAKYGYDLVTRP